MVQWLRLHLPMQGVQVRSLIGKLRSHMPHGQKPKHKTRNIVTISIKTLKKKKRDDSTHGHHQMVNTEIRLTIFLY